MELRRFGDTGLEVSALGLGMGQLGAAHLSEADVDGLLGAALDEGVTLWDTAPGYGEAEARLGRWLRGSPSRRAAVVVSTKVGYGVEGEEDWTGRCVTLGVEQALRRLGTSWLDVVHLHSCGEEVLARGEVIEALERARAAGKVRVVAYSGDGGALAWAVASGRFGSVQASASVCDQRFLGAPLHAAKTAQLGVIAKRPLANAPWRFDARPVGHYGEAYWERWRAMGAAELLDGRAPGEVALRFAVYTFGIDACIVGTTRPAHLRANAEAVRAGKLPEAQIERLREAFWRHGAGWESLV